MKGQYKLRLTGLDLLSLKKNASELKICTLVSIVLTRIRFEIPKLPSHPGCHITLSRVPCALQSLLVILFLFMAALGLSCGLRGLFTAVCGPFVAM